DVLAGQHHVAGELGPGLDASGLALRPRALLDKTQPRPIAPQGFARTVERQPPGIGGAVLDPSALLVRRQRPAAIDAVLRALAAPVRRAADVIEHFAAGLEAAVDEALVCELVERGMIVGEMLGLAPHRRLPLEAEPGQVLVDRRLELRPAAAEIDVLD